MSTPIFSGRIPDGLFYNAEFDMWVRYEADEIVIGASSYGLFLAAAVIAFTPKPTGAHMAYGRGFGTIECAKTILALHAPMAFELTAANEAAETTPQLLQQDPYGHGWMVRGHALDETKDRARLLTPEAYRAHILATHPNALVQP